MKGALPSDQISAQQYPRTFAWITRFDKTISAISKRLGKPKTVKGDEAAKLIAASDFVEAEGNVEDDPTKLKKGQRIEVWPTDSGFKNKDCGPLVALTTSEVVIGKTTKNGEKIRLHAPRHGFRVKALDRDSGTKL